MFCFHALHNIQQHIRSELSHPSWSDCDVTDAKISRIFQLMEWDQPSGYQILGWIARFFQQRVIQYYLEKELKAYSFTAEREIMQVINKLMNQYSLPYTLFQFVNQADFKNDKHIFIISLLTKLYPNFTIALQSLAEKNDKLDRLMKHLQTYDDTPIQQDINDFLAKQLKILPSWTVPYKERQQMGEVLAHPTGQIECDYVGRSTFDTISIFDQKNQPIGGVHIEETNIYYVSQPVFNCKNLPREEQLRAFQQGIEQPLMQRVESQQGHFQAQLYEFLHQGSLSTGAWLIDVAMLEFLPCNLNALWITRYNDEDCSRTLQINIESPQSIRFTYSMLCSITPLSGSSSPIPISCRYTMRLFCDPINHEWISSDPKIDLFQINHAAPPLEQPIAPESRQVLLQGLSRLYTFLQSKVWPWLSPVLTIEN